MGLKEKFFNNIKVKCEEFSFNDIDVKFEDVFPWKTEVVSFDFIEIMSNLNFYDPKNKRNVFLSFQMLFDKGDNIFYLEFYRNLKNEDMIPINKSDSSNYFSSCNENIIVVNYYLNSVIELFFDLNPSLKINGLLNNNFEYVGDFNSYTISNKYIK